MPLLEPDPTDPSMLVGNVVDCTQDELREMAASFAAELAQMGYSADAIAGYFRDPSYAGPNLAWRELGDQVVQQLVGEAVGFWGRFRFTVREPAATQSGLLSIGNPTKDQR